MREAILDAATELLAERGYGRTTVQAIAERAECAAGTVYNHFLDKEDLLRALLERLREEETVKVELAAGGDFRAFVAAWIAQRTEAMRESEPLVRALLAEMLVRPELRAAYRRELLQPRLAAGEAYLRRVVEREAAPPDAGDAMVPDPAITVRLLVAAVLGLGLLRLLDEPLVHDRWEDCCAELTALLLDGLSSLAADGASR